MATHLRISIQTADVIDLLMTIAEFILMIMITIIIIVEIIGVMKIIVVIQLLITIHRTPILIRTHVPILDLTLLKQDLISVSPPSRTLVTTRLNLHLTISIRLSLSTCQQLTKEYIPLNKQGLLPLNK